MKSDIIQDCVCSLDSSYFDEIVTVWEESVRATHEFLAPADIDFYKPFVIEALLNLQLIGLLVDGQLLGFAALDGEKIEMLFVTPWYMGKGAGSLLIEYAVNVLGAKSVDVNEQNRLAEQFYIKKGFQVVSRDETDASGKPYPILHMKLKKQ